MFPIQSFSITQKSFIVYRKSRPGQLVRSSDGVRPPTMGSENQFAFNCIYCLVVTCRIRRKNKKAYLLYVNDFRCKISLSGLDILFQLLWFQQQHLIGYTGRSTTMHKEAMLRPTAALKRTHGHRGTIPKKNRSRVLSIYSTAGFVFPKARINSLLPCVGEEQRRSLVLQNLIEAVPNTRQILAVAVVGEQMTESKAYGKYATNSIMLPAKQARSVHSTGLK